MFELLLKVCVGAAFCHYTTPPVNYDSLPLCQQQAGLIAGMQAGRYAPGEDVQITFRCTEHSGGVRQPADWVVVSLLSDQQ